MLCCQQQIWPIFALWHTGVPLPLASPFSSCPKEVATPLPLHICPSSTITNSHLLPAHAVFTTTLKSQKTPYQSDTSQGVNQPTKSSNVLVPHNPSTFHILLPTWFILFSLEKCLYYFWIYMLSVKQFKQCRKTQRKKFST